MIIDELAKERRWKWAESKLNRFLRNILKKEKKEVQQLEFVLNISPSVLSQEKRMSNLFQEMIETNTVFNTTCARKILRGLFFCLFCFCFEGSHIDFYARRQCQDPVSLVPATFKFASTLVVSSVNATE